jgi:hypothetical protein
MKTVIFILKQSYIFPHKNLPYIETSWGLGDLLRGVFGIYTLSKVMGFRLIVDFSHHPISLFLKNEQHEFGTYVAQNIENVPYIFAIDNISPVTQYIDNMFSTHDVITMFTSFGLYAYNATPSSDAQEFMKRLLTPKPAFQEYIDTQMKLVPYSTYSVIHYRLGDHELVLNNNKDVNKGYVHHVMANRRENDILLSDSQSLKRAATDIFTFNESICHVGTSMNEPAIRHTLFELFLLSKATAIRSYSHYVWVSGFVTIISKIYDIPLEGYCNFRG